MGDVAVGARSGPGEPEEGRLPPGGEPAGGDPGTGGEPGDATGRAGEGEPAGQSAEDGRPADGIPEQDGGGKPRTREPGREGDGGDGGEGQQPRKQRSFWKELPLLIGIAIVLALLIKTFLVQAFSIPSDSMQNTLQRGDRVLVDKLTPWFGWEPERGDVIVFSDPGGWLSDSTSDSGGIGGAVQEALSAIGLVPSAEDQDLIKRVIAVGGDTVECKGEGPVYVNGEPLDESDYLYPGNTACGDKPFGPITVPEGRLWVMGDHRQDSLDSRYHQDLAYQGTISVDDVVGRAVVVAWPVTRWSMLSAPDSYDELSAAYAVVTGPTALAVTGAVPLVLRRRRRLLRWDGAGSAHAGQNGDKDQRKAWRKVRGEVRGGG